MTLYEFVNLHGEDYDVYDNEYDESVTVCYIDKIRDGYDAFCAKIMKKVSVVDTTYDDEPIANWSELIHRNMPVFKSFTEEHWRRKYRDDMDEFVYQWIKEIHLYFAGYVSEDFYTILIDFVDAMEAV